jgi:hypothetical protein
MGGNKPAESLLTGLLRGVERSSPVYTGVGVVVPER